MIACQFIGNGEPEAGAANRTSKCFKQMLARRRRQAGTGIGNFEHRAGRVAPAGHPHGAAGALRGDGLDGVFRQIHQDAVELIAVRPQTEIAGDIVTPLDGAGLAGNGGGLAGGQNERDFVDQRRQENLLRWASGSSARAKLRVWLHKLIARSIAPSSGVASMLRRS